MLRISFYLRPNNKQFASSWMSNSISLLQPRVRRVIPSTSITTLSTYEMDSRGSLPIIYFCYYQLLLNHYEVIAIRARSHPVYRKYDIVWYFQSRSSLWIVLVYNVLMLLAKVYNTWICTTRVRFHGIMMHDTKAAVFVKGQRRWYMFNHTQSYVNGEWRREGRWTTHTRPT